jgi:phosphatidylinositol 4-kinase type 2
MRDVDFQEKMFAKQMAIIKGQAWNVVETLKSPDHGPLELTRRARVCVWDDLVEVPIAVPLRTQSTEIRRNKVTVHYDDEMDISAAGTSVPPMVTVPPKDPQDLLMSSPELERSNPFNYSRQSSQIEERDSFELNGRTLSPPNVLAMSNSVHSDGPVTQSSRRPVQPGRMSFDESRRSQRVRQTHSRRLSHSARLVGGAANDDDDGDLGYAATADREANRQRVIVERLENVKSKNPVFTWC